MLEGARAVGKVKALAEPIHEDARIGAVGYVDARVGPVGAVGGEEDVAGRRVGHVAAGAALPVDGGGADGAHTHAAQEAAAGPQRAHEQDGQREAHGGVDAVLDGGEGR